MKTGTSTRTLQNNGLNYRIQSLHVGMQPPGSSVTRTKEMLAYIGQKVWLVSNWMQHMLTSYNIAQHGVQTNATCCAQHVGATCCVRLHGPYKYRTLYTVYATNISWHSTFNGPYAWWRFADQFHHHASLPCSICTLFPHFMLVFF